MFYVYLEAKKTEQSLKWFQNPKQTKTKKSHKFSLPSSIAKEIFRDAREELSVKVATRGWKYLLGDD
jgi:hypothetical protein